MFTYYQSILAVFHYLAALKFKYILTGFFNLMESTNANLEIFVLKSGSKSKSLNPGYFLLMS